MNEYLLEEDPVKLVIVMRTKFPDGKGGTFGMRLGKSIAQGSHSTSEFLIEKLNLLDVLQCSFWSRVKFGLALIFGRKPIWNYLEKEWLVTGKTKICVRAESEEELLSVFRQAKQAQLPVHLITDAGRTEFKEATDTCLAIGPARSSDIDKITGHLKLL